MSTNRKILKGLSIFALVIDVAMVVFSVLVFLGIALDPTSALEAASQSRIVGMSSTDMLGLVLGGSVGAFGLGLIDGIVSVMGIRGANDPTKMGFVTVAAGVSLALTFVAVVFSAIADGFSLANLLVLGFASLYFVLCDKVRQEGKALAFAA